MDWKFKWERTEPSGYWHLMWGEQYMGLLMRQGTQCQFIGRHRLELGDDIDRAKAAVEMIVRMGGL